MQDERNNHQHKLHVGLLNDENEDHKPKGLQPSPVLINRLAGMTKVIVLVSVEPSVNLAVVVAEVRIEFTDAHVENLYNWPAYTEYQSNYAGSQIQLRAWTVVD